MLTPRPLHIPVEAAGNTTRGPLHDRLYSVMSPGGLGADPSKSVETLGFVRWFAGNTGRPAREVTATCRYMVGMPESELDYLWARYKMEVDDGS